jgi:hypothetical protein
MPDICHEKVLLDADEEFWSLVLADPGFLHEEFDAIVAEMGMPPHQPGCFWDRGGSNSRHFHLAFPTEVVPRIQTVRLTLERPAERSPPR